MHAHLSTDERSEFLQMWRNPVEGHILSVNKSVSHQVSQLLQSVRQLARKLDSQSISEVVYMYLQVSKSVVSKKFSRLVSHWVK